MKKIIGKKALCSILAVLMLAAFIPYGASTVSASGAVIEVTSEAELIAALNNDSPVEAINIKGEFTVNEECTIEYDAAHLENYHDTIVTIDKSATITVGNGGVLGSFWPSYEGDWETPPVPNGKVINNGTLIVEEGGALDADFDTNNGIITVKDGGNAVCCNTNNGTVEVQSGAFYATSQGTNAVNNGVLKIHQGAVMQSQMGSNIVNTESGIIQLDGDFMCGCLGFDGGKIMFENSGTVTGGGKVYLYEAAPDFAPVSDMDRMIEQMMAALGQETRFDNWEDIGIYKQYIVSSYEEIATRITGERIVAGETVNGDMDVVFYIVSDITIPEGESLETMALIGISDWATVTVGGGATLEAGIESRGTINVLSGGNLFTTMGGNIVNHNTINVAEGATLKSQMGGCVINDEGAKLTLDGTFYCGCISYGGNDNCWFENRGEVDGKGTVILYEAAPELMPLADPASLAVRVNEQLSNGGAQIELLVKTTGDADADGTVDLKDILQIKKFISLLVDTDGLSLLNADANTDGYVNMKDVLMVMRVIAE
ncbi:MAG: dockerin type I repeat-containing protein [Clostridia bacterium]|nr:dockerin type I repeat-containing protein [Clostridia bacterium]